MILWRSGFFVRLFSVCMSLVMDSGLTEGMGSGVQGQRQWCHFHFFGVRFPLPPEWRRWSIFKFCFSGILFNNTYKGRYILHFFEDVFVASFSTFFSLKFPQLGSVISVDPTFTDNRSISSLEATPGTEVPSNSLFWQLSTLFLAQQEDGSTSAHPPTRSQKFWPRSSKLKQTGRKN